VLLKRIRAAVLDNKVIEDCERVPLLLLVVDGPLLTQTKLLLVEAVHLLPLDEYWVPKEIVHGEDQAVIHATQPMQWRLKEDLTAIKQPPLTVPLGLLKLEEGPPSVACLLLIVLKCLNLLLSMGLTSCGSAAPAELLVLEMDL